MISYLPAFVTVGIVQSICRPAGAALAIQNATGRIGFRQLKKWNLTLLPDLPSSISWSSPAEMPPPTPGRPTLHSTHRIFCWSTLLPYQCFALDTVGAPESWELPSSAFRRRRRQECPPQIVHLRAFHVFVGSAQSVFFLPSPKGPFVRIFSAISTHPSRIRCIVLARILAGGSP